MAGAGLLMLSPVLPLQCRCHLPAAVPVAAAVGGGLGAMGVTLVCGSAGLPGTWQRSGEDKAW